MLNQAVSRSGSQATIRGAVFGFRLSSRQPFPYSFGVLREVDPSYGQRGVRTD
jgi:hypothetical protein